VRADHNTPLLSSKTEAELGGRTTQANGDLYAIAKVQSDKSCPIVVNALPQSVVRSFIVPPHRAAYSRSGAASPFAALNRLDARTFRILDRAFLSLGQTARSPDTAAR